MEIHFFDPIIPYFLLSLVVIILLLSMLHFYWAFGGTWGFRKAFPVQSYHPNLEFFYLQCKEIRYKPTQING